MTPPIQTPSALAPVRAVVDAYVQATRTRDVPDLQRIFHPHAVMTVWRDGASRNGGPDPFHRMLETRELADHFAAQIIRLEVEENIGLAALVEATLFGEDCVNHFNLVRDDALG